MIKCSGITSTTASPQLAPTVCQDQGKTMDDLGKVQQSCTSQSHLGHQWIEDQCNSHPLSSQVKPAKQSHYTSQQQQQKKQTPDHPDHDK